MWVWLEVQHAVGGWRVVLGSGSRGETRDYGRQEKAMFVESGMHQTRGNRFKLKLFEMGSSELIEEACNPRTCLASVLICVLLLAKKTCIRWPLKNTC